MERFDCLVHPLLIMRLYQRWLLFSVIQLFRLRAAPFVTGIFCMRLAQRCCIILSGYFHQYLWLHLEALDCLRRGSFLKPTAVCVERLAALRYLRAFTLYLPNRSWFTQCNCIIYWVVDSLVVWSESTHQCVVGN